jgi:hypothetical protein
LVDDNIVSVIMALGGRASDSTAKWYVSGAGAHHASLLS